METQMIIEFILDWYGILFAVLFIATKLLLDYEKVKETILEYMVDLESELESNVDRNIDFIVDDMYPFLPRRIRLFVKEDDFRAMVEFFYEKLIIYKKNY